MPRKMGWIEAGAIVVALGACATAAPLLLAAPVPDGVDYVRAVQCGGLMKAEAAVAPTLYLHDQNLARADQFVAWARVRADENGQDASLASQDVDVSRDDFIGAAGNGSKASQRQRLYDAYPGEIRACGSLSTILDLVVIGG